MSRNNAVATTPATSDKDSQHNDWAKDDRFLYGDGMSAAFEKASQVLAASVHKLKIADITFHLEIVGSELESATLPALAHLLASVDVGYPPDITLRLWDGAETGMWPPELPFTPNDYRRYGQRAVAHDGDHSLMHAPTSGQIFAYDRINRLGYYWVKDATQLSIYERAAPVQTLFQWALVEFGWQIVHAAGVGNAEGGVLMIGNSGAGKSTTALSCLTQAGLNFLCDDKCLARLDPEPQAFALFSSAKIKADMLERLPHLRPFLAGWDNNYKANKGLVFLHPTYTDHLISTFPIKALLLPKVAHRTETAIRPAAQGDIFRQLGPSTVIWLPGTEEDNYRFTAGMVRRLPRHHLELAMEPQSNVEIILRLIEGI